MIKAAIFDFDGTLTALTLDFEHIKDEVVAVARKYVEERAINEVEAYYIIEMIFELGNRMGERGATLIEEAFEKLRCLELEAAKGKDTFPFTRDVLKSLKDRGIKTGIITRSCMDVLGAVFPDAKEYIDAVVTREHTQQVKPHPGQVLQILGILGIPPEEALLVGDHPTDAMAGNAAGCLTVGVLSGRTAREEFEKAGATYIFDDIRGVLGIVSDGRMGTVKKR
jgi:phosphoglycolate phosphatase